MLPFVWYHIISENHVLTIEPLYYLSIYINRLLKFLFDLFINSCYNIGIGNYN